MFSRKKDINNYALILDIRSSSVAGAIVYFPPKKRPTVIYTERAPVYFEERQTPGKFIDRMLKRLDILVNDVTHNGGKALVDFSHKKILLNNVICFYASPWYANRSRELELKTEKSFVFNKKFMDKIIEEDEKRSQDESSNKNIETIEKDIVQIVLNGYQASDPFNKRATDLKINFHISAMSKTTLENIEDIIRKHLPGAHINHRTHSLTFFNLIRNMFIDENDFVLIDIGGEVTDLSIVRDDTLVNTITIPYGKHHFLRHVVKQCKLDTHTALSSINMFAEGKKHEKCDGNVKKALKDSQIYWISSLEKSLKDLGKVEESSLPNKVFITCDNDVISLVKMITGSKMFKNNVFNSKRAIDTKILDQLMFRDLVDYPKGVEKDIMINLETTFLSSSAN